MEPTCPTPPRVEAFYSRVFALVTLFVLGVLLFRILWPLFSPIAWSIFIAFLLHPIHRWLIRRTEGRSSLSALLLTLATVVVLIGPLTALGAAFAAQAGQALDALQKLAAEQVEIGARDPGNLPVVGQLMDWLQWSVGVSRERIQEWAGQAGRSVLQFLAPLGGKLFLGAIGRMLAFALSMFMLFFFIRDGQRMMATVRALIPMSPEEKSRLFKHLGEVIRAVVYGSGLTALMQGVLIGIGFAVLGLPTPLVFGVLAALFALIPLTGTPVVWVPAVITLAVQGRWVATVVLLAWGILVTTVDNVVRPYLVAGKADIGTLPVFIGVLGGVAAFGAVGLLLGPFVLALVFALIRFTLEMRCQDGADL